MNDYREMELLINYCRKRLEELPQGYFTKDSKTSIVCVTRDPADPDNTTRHRYRVNTPAGRFWTQLIMEYEKIKRQYDYLISIWNATYRFPPRSISYPLIKSSTNIFTAQFFEEAKEMANPSPIEHPIRYKDRILRSKNELIGCQLIEKLGYEYKVEIAVGNDPFDMLYPDITFMVPEQERCIGIEINGALDRPGYAAKSLNRQSSYINKGLMISKDIIFIDIADPGSFYAKLFETQVRLAVLAGIDDIVFP